MKSKSIISFVAFLLCFSLSLRADNGKQKNKGQKKSNVSIELSKDWQYRDASISTAVWKEAKVPGCIHTDLLRNGEIPDPYYRLNEQYVQWVDKHDWEYRTTFSVSADVCQSKTVSLLFKGLDTYADVYLNGQQILVADNMFRTWKVNVKPFVKLGENELRIFFHSPIKVGLDKLKAFGYALPAINDAAVAGQLNEDDLVSVFERKAPYHFGWDWGPRMVTSGVYRPIYLVAQNTAVISDVFYRQDKVTKSKASIGTQVTVNSLRDSEKVTVTIRDKESNKVYAKKSVSLFKGENMIDMPFTIKNPELWWTNGLGEQHLYHFVATVENKGEVVCTKEHAIAVRSLKLVEKSDGTKKGMTLYFELNGVPVFMKGANHIPNDVFVDRMTRDVYDNEIADAVNANMNMLRVWGGGIYEDDYFYKLCDENGLLVWQDFMFACSMYPSGAHFTENVRQEAIDNVKRLRNHGCIAVWCGNNEMEIAWNQYKKKGGWHWKERHTAAQQEQIWAQYEKLFFDVLPGVVAQYDNRSYRSSSPTVPEKYKVSTSKHTHSGDIHYWGVWHGKKPFETFYDVLGRFMSEYGFQSFPEMTSINKYALPEDYDINSPVMANHQKSRKGNYTITEYMKMYYKVPTNFVDYIYLQQVLQAKGLKMAIEAHRGNMHHTMGTLYWQINDCWPVASWSSTDYYRRWKAAHYFVKKAYAPLLITARKIDNNLVVRMVSDELTKIPGVQVELTVMDVNGDVKLTRERTLTLPANESTVVINESCDKLFNGPNEFAVLRATSKGQVIAENVFYPTKMKDMDLPVSNVDIDVKAQSDKVFTFTVKSDKLVKNLCISLGQVEGFFSDNYMDVLPNETLTLTYTAKKPTTVAALKKQLKWESVGKVVSNIK